MEFIQRKPHYPGALSDTAADLLRTIYNAGVWFPHWQGMSHLQITAFAELQRAAYVEATAFFGYRVKGRDNMSVIRQYQQERNEQLNELYSVNDPLITKWEARAQIINFRLRPWMERVRVREAHLQLEDDIKLSKLELKRGA